MTSVVVGRRQATVAVAVLLLLATPVGVVAAGPGNGAKGNDPADYIVPGSQADKDYQAKLAGAASYLAADIAAISGGPDSPEPFSDNAVLGTQSREQYKSYYCGPASGQVVINYTRGVSSPNLDGQNAGTNYMVQTDLADAMGTDSGGTWGADVASTVNEFAITPYSGFYHFQAPGDGATFHSWAEYDIAGYGVPVVAEVVPHDQGVQYFLPNWPKVMTTNHFIVVRGYDGFWDGTDDPVMYYNDSASPSGPGRYTAGALTVWKVIKYAVAKVVW
jgi:hypothetical protein